MKIQIAYFKTKSKHYKIEVYPSYDNTLVWAAYVESEEGWVKMPLMTKTQERKFPKSLLKFAHNFWIYCQQT